MSAILLIASVHSVVDVRPFNRPVPPPKSALEKNSFQKNKGSILEALRRHLPLGPSGMMLEVASGSGAHCAHWASELPSWTIQPSEVETESFGSISGYARGHANIVLPPKMLDARNVPSCYGAAGSADAVVAINMCHIAPFDATLGLLAGCSHVLRPGPSARANACGGEWWLPFAVR